MTPAARYQAAIEILDEILAGQPAERALTRWARGSRFAGSRDRAAVRDHVFDVLRQKRSCALRGGAETGRGLILGLLRQAGVPSEEVFSGDGYGPAPLSAEEHLAGAQIAGRDGWDLPDWLCDRFEQSLGQNAEAVARSLRSRAPVFIRVNPQRTSLEKLQARLAEEGITCASHELCDTALEVTEGTRRLTATKAFQEGCFDLQDVASQAVAAALPLGPNDRVLDYCAGGGGKSLALAARRPDARIDAHDADPGRMKDLPARANRRAPIFELCPRPREPTTSFYVTCHARDPVLGDGPQRVNGC